MTEKNTNTEFMKYRLTWRFTDDGELQESFFWLPKNIEPSEYVGSILSVVELSASEYGYEYTLEEVTDPVIVTGLVHRVLGAVDDFNADLENKSKDAFDVLEKARTDDTAKGCDRWEKDSSYMKMVEEGDADDQAYYSRIITGIENCFDCLWHGGKGEGCHNPNLKNESTLYIRLQRESLQESEALGDA